MDFLKNLRGLISFEVLTKSVPITFIYIITGSLLSGAFMFFATLAGMGTFASSFLRNIGWAIILLSVMLSYAGIFIIDEDKSKSIIGAMKDSLKKTHYIAAVAFGTIFGFFIIALFQVLISMIGFIPYAGAYIIALLTIPFFIINFVCVIICLCVFIIAPPMIVKGKTLKETALDSLKIIQSKWAEVLLYIGLSGFIIFIFLIIVFVAARYAGGVTKSVQWNIVDVYSKGMSYITGKSSMTDMIDKIVPSPVMVYGQNALRMILSVSYGIIVSVIMSFILAVYLQFTSSFSKNLND